ncbi:hypothetical protein NMG60_11024644 [Bertholletia excelsa]
MTMINPRQNLSKPHHHHRTYGGGGGGYGGGGCFVSTCTCSEEASSVLGSESRTMAEDDSRTTEAGSSSKDVEDERNDEGWLQLGIGAGHVTTTRDDDVVNNNNKPNRVDPRPGLVELDLMPPGGSSSQQVMRPLPLPIPPVFHVSRPTSGYGASSLFLQHPGTSSVFQEMNWAVRPVPRNIGIAAACSPSSSSSSLMPTGLYFSRPFPLQPAVDVAGSSSELRIVDPPRRSHSGIWFVLQASENQVKEPFLPQIPKNYLRIKDGRMTVRLLMKYLVNKLRLDSESEIEITCRGQRLLPFLTLQHVRDNIWTTPRDAVILLPDSSPKDHVMVLHYARSA